MNWCLVLIIALVRSTTGLEQEAASTAESISENNQENFENHLYVLSHYVFLWYWMFDSLENTPKEKVGCMFGNRISQISFLISIYIFLEES